jgi:hypothetical protein
MPGLDPGMLVPPAARWGGRGEAGWKSSQQAAAG